MDFVKFQGRHKSIGLTVKKCVEARDPVISVVIGEDVAVGHPGKKVRNSERLNDYSFFSRLGSKRLLQFQNQTRNCQ